jgi:fatty-acyl-CoA synthase
LDGPSLFAAIDTNGVTFLCGVPTIWQMLIDHAEKSGKSFPSLRRAGIGGSSPSPMLVQRIEDLGVEVFHAWGMTETNPFGGTGFLKPRDEALPKDTRLNRKLGQGRPVFGLKRRIVNEEGTPLPHDGVTPGRLVVQGNWVVARYVNVDDSPLRDGWFDTGDIASIDEDGYMVITDRAKDLIKSGGEWISSIELENVAYERVEIMHCAALGRPDSRWGERPVLVLATHAGATVDEAVVLEHMKRRLPSWQVPEEIIVQPELPLTAAGKIDKKLLRKLLFS